MDAIWPIISNKEAIAVNQAWAGHSGSPFKEASEQVLVTGWTSQNRKGLLEVQEDFTVPSWQYFYKPIGDGKVAIFMMNHASASANLKLDFKDVPGLTCSSCHVRDIWNHKDAGTMNELALDVAPHDSAFLVLSAASDSRSEIVV